MSGSVHTRKVIIVAKITKKMILGDVVREHPETVNVFLNHGLACVMCHMASQESVEDGAKAHGIDVSKLIKDLNKAVAKKK